MFEHAPFLGQVRLAQTSYPVNYPMPGPEQDWEAECASWTALVQKSAAEIAAAHQRALAAQAQGNSYSANYAAEDAARASRSWQTYKTQADYACSRVKAQRADVRQQGYPVQYPWETPPSPPPPRPPVQTPRSPMRTGNIPEGAYLPTPTTGTQQAQGLPCPEGQYRPPGGGWCVPKPVTTAYRGIPTVQYGSLFSGGFFGGGQGASAASFT